MNTEELARTPEGIVPLRLPAVNAVKDAPDPANPVAVSIPVEGTKLSLEDVVFCGRLPVLAVTQVRNTADAFAASSVIPVLTALVALVADAAEPSMLVIPVRDIAPELRFKATDVVPMNTEELPSTPEGMVPDRLPAVRDVREAPEPANPVAVNIPVEGTNESLVLVSFAAPLPEVAVVHTG
jgi:hypothetical protein